MRISRRRSLLVALIIGELACMVGGGVWFTHWLNTSASRMCGQQILADNKLIAGQFANIIEQMGLRDVRLGSNDWVRLQKLVEQTELPNRGFICVIDNPHGRLICHPKLREKPEMAEMKPGQAALNATAGTGPIVDFISASGLATGRVRLPDGVHLISAKRIPGLDMNIMAHQHQSGVDASVARLTRPILFAGAVVAVCVVLLTAVASFAILRRYEDRLQQVNEQLEVTVRRRTQALVKTRNATVFGLAKLADSRDTDTGDHLERIQHYVGLLAAELAQHNPEITPAFIDDLQLASSLHDIGKVGIPDSVLLKPGRLNENERAIIQTHAAIGGDCLAQIELRLGDDGFLQMARNIAYSHHERWDGKGYPSGLTGTEIPIEARIVAVADVYDALTTKRPYKDAMDHREAYRLIVAETGTQFDPDVVRAFVMQEEAFALHSGRRRLETLKQPAAAELQSTHPSEVVVTA